jgi:sugar phosphate permease
MTPNGPPLSNGTADRLLSFFWRKPPGTLAERARRRITLHLIPYLFFLYILAYLDRVNVSVAELKMIQPPDSGGLGFDRATIGLGAGLFFWGYIILEIPSTVSVTRWGARWVFARILVLWGLCAALVGLIGLPFASALFSWLPHIPESSWRVLSAPAHFINGLHDTPAYQFYFFRFMLGFFEGGFFPSVIVYLSHWFRPEDRAKSIASFMAAIPLSSMVGLPLSGLLLDVHWFGLPGWRWIFLIQGLAPVLAGFATLFFLPDGPASARWLPADERAWLLAELDTEHQSKHGHGLKALAAHLDVVLLLTAVYFCINVTSYGLQMFMPAIIKSNVHVSSQTASFLAALPYAFSLLGMLINGWHSDRTGERIWHVATPLAGLTVALIMAVLCDGVPVVPVLLMIVCVGVCLHAHLPSFWPIPTMFLGATAAAAAIGFINMTGNLGGFFGPWAVGLLANSKTISPTQAAQTVGLLGSPLGHGPLLAATSLTPPVTSFRLGLLFVAPWPLLAAIIIVALGYRRRSTARAKPVS